jgi:hypothetical protein
MASQYSDRLRFLSYDLLFILFWVATWGLMETAVNMLTRHSKKPRLVFYALLALAAALTMVFMSDDPHARS